MSEPTEEEVQWAWDEMDRKELVAGGKYWQQAHADLLMSLLRAIETIRLQRKLIRKLKGKLAMRPGMLRRFWAFLKTKSHSEEARDEH